MPPRRSYVRPLRLAGVDKSFYSNFPRARKAPFIGLIKKKKTNNRGYDKKYKYVQDLSVRLKVKNSKI